MPRIPKVVGIKQNTHDGLWKEFGEKLRGRFTDAQRPMPSGHGLHKAKLRSASRLRLERAFQSEDRGE